MSGGSESGGEKIFDPTPQKLEDARRKGDVPRSMDLSAAAGFIGLFLAIVAGGSSIVDQFGGVLQNVIGNSDRLTGKILSNGGDTLAFGIFLDAMLGLAPLFVLPFVASFLALFAQRAFAFAPEKLVPKGNRLDPIGNAKNKFGPTGLVQFAKSVIKMVAVSTALTFYLIHHEDVLIGSMRSTGPMIAVLLGETLVELMAIACAIYLLIGLVDILWQRFDHARKLRMTFEEMREEQKQAEGDPHVKQKRRQKGQEIATNQMLQDVPKADVIIVNPTHYAVALKWSRAKGSAPVCVAKGVDEIAARIRELASEAGVPIHRDPPTARAIHDVVDVGSEIEPQHYRAVAAAVRFAAAMRKKARNSVWT